MTWFVVIRRGDDVVSAKREVADILEALHSRVGYYDAQLSENLVRLVHGDSRGYDTHRRPYSRERHCNNRPAQPEAVPIRNEAAARAKPSISHG